MKKIFRYLLLSCVFFMLVACGKKESQKAFANKLKDEEYAAKYARAKYYYSKQGEYIYTIPGLLPQ